MLTCDDFISIQKSDLGPILDFLDSHDGYAGMRTALAEAPEKSGYVEISASLRYHLSSAIRCRLASIDWMETDTTGPIRGLIKALRLVHNC